MCSLVTYHSTIAPALRVILTPNGTYGDVHPYVGIAHALRARGHEVIFACNPFFDTLIRNAGFRLVPVRSAEELLEYWDHPDMWDSHNYWKVGLEYCALRPMRELYAAVVAHQVPGETIVAGPAWSFGARVAQESIGVPMATLHLEPFWLRSLHETAEMPSPMVTRSWVPRPLKRLQFWIADHLFTDHFLAGPVNTFRAELGLPAVKDFLCGWWNSPQQIIGLFPNWFASAPPDWPPQTHLTGFPIWDRVSQQAVGDDARRFVESGPPPIVFAPGTANRQATAFFAAASEACEIGGWRGLLLSDFPQQLPATLSPRIRHFDYVPFSYLLPRAAAVVHHAGTGTAALCMRAGIPQVVMPMAYDQPDFARRLVSLGVAARINPNRFTGPMVAETLRRLLQSSDTKQNCKRIASRFVNVEPIAQICDLLEQLVSGA